MTINDAHLRKCITWLNSLCHEEKIKFSSKDLAVRRAPLYYASVLLGIIKTDYYWGNEVAIQGGFTTSKMRMICGMKVKMVL